MNWYKRAQVNEEYSLMGYHGSDDKFDNFEYQDSYRTVLFSRFPVKTKGFFFAPNSEEAGVYGDNVTEHRLDIKKPLLDGSSGVNRESQEIERDLNYILEPLIYKDDQGNDSVDVGVQKYLVDKNDPMWIYNMIVDGKLVWDALDNDAVVERMGELGYDGTFVYEDQSDSETSYFVLNPDQIRNASNKSWHKQAQVNILNFDEHDQMYYGIGHDYLEHESEIWIWDRGRLFTESGAMSHGRLSKQLSDAGITDSGGVGVPTRYHGRYENRNGQKRVSIKPSTRMHFHGTSPQLIKDLQTEYGSDIEIYTFE